MSPPKQIDLNGTPCRTCSKGIYCETSLSDGWDGVLHCTNCSAKVTRYLAPPSRFTIFADGACKANGKLGGGLGGWGAVIRNEDTALVQELSGAQTSTTNNQMELLAVIKALNALPLDCDVQVWTDSQYVVKGMNEWIAGWKRRGWLKGDGSEVLNSDLWRSLEKGTLGRRVTWHWVRGHDGHAGNEHADRLAQAAAETLR